MFGTLALFVAVGLAICFSLLFGTPGWGRVDSAIGFGVASVVALFGAGLFVASRFLEKPLPKGDHD